MPRIMTMNGDHQRVATTPLDLRTTNRERGTPDCNGRVRDARATGGSPAPSAYTGTESLEKHCTAVRGSESVASRKRPADKSSLRLPLRKRPVPVEPETERQSVEPETERAPIRPPSRDRFLPAYSTFRDSFGGQAADENRVGPASGTPRRNEVVGHGPGGYPIPFLYPVDYVPLYFFSGLHPVNCLPPVQELNHTVTQLAEADIALATHQDEDGDTALHIAVVQGELAIVDKLIQLFLLAHRSLDIYNNLRQTPLHLAVITEQANLVKALLTAGADPTALDRNGQTAVHLCCEYNQCDCLSVVLSHSSSSTCLETRNYDGLSPLHLAVLRGHKDLAKMLLDAGGDINAMDIKSGQSPLMHAVESNNADMVHFLIESGCDVNSQSYSGNTALHSACGRGQVDTVRLLLKSGADISLKNYHNDTPVMVAKNKKITDVLRGRGSNQMRVQDQQCVSVSSHETNLTENGSPSPNHSRGSSPSPSTTLHSFHHNSSHSPMTPLPLVFPFF